MSDSKPTLVVAAILMQKDRILICQRHRNDAYGLQWEFPGGKVRAGEELPAALRRELREELGIEAEIGREVYRLKYHYPDRYVKVVFFSVAGFRGNIRNQVFESIEWTSRGQLLSYNFLAADRELVEGLTRRGII